MRPAPRQRAENTGSRFVATVSPGRPKARRGIAASIVAAITWWATAHAATGARFIDDWGRMKSIVPQSYVCSHAAGTITIDGRLDEGDWKRVPWTRDFQDIEGESKPAPRFRTRAKMLWDDEYFYVAAALEEPHVWGTITNHDAVIFQDNDFEVFIDPDGDTHEYYEFEMNALNTGWDLFLKKPYKDGGPALNEWEIPGLKTAVHVNGTLNDPADRDQGWTVEIAFPWRVLAEFAHRPAPPREGDQWRVDFSRVEWQITIRDGRYEKVPGTREDNWVWSPQGIVDMHRPEKWGYVQFSRKAAGDAPFVEDPGRVARGTLQEIYYAQRDFEAANHHWATSLKELDWSGNSQPLPPKSPWLRATAEGFECTVEVPLPNGRVERWHIRQDARVWKE